MTCYVKNGYSGGKKEKKWVLCVRGMHCQPLACRADIENFSATASQASRDADRD